MRVMIIGGTGFMGPHVVFSLHTNIDTRPDLVVDTSRTRYELGYAELTSRDAALRRTVAWERANKVSSARA